MSDSKNPLQVTAKGWGWPGKAPKAHYFYMNPVSLCGRWLYTGELEEGNDKSPDNCKKCESIKRREVDPYAESFEQGRNEHGDGSHSSQEGDVHPTPSGSDPDLL